MKYFQFFQFFKSTLDYNLKDCVKSFSYSSNFLTNSKKIKYNDSPNHVSIDSTTQQPSRNKKSQINYMFPDKLMRRKQKSPNSFYIADDIGAEIIIKHLLNHVRKDIPIMEINPGPGLLTRKLLAEEETFQKILLIEYLDHFMPYLEELHSLYPEKIKVKQNDMINLWKLSYQDKLDNGSRVADLFIDVPKKLYTDDPNITVFAGVGSYNFFKHLINSLVFQNSLLSYGRCEMFLVIPPPLYIHLTCDNEVGYLIYRATSILFQIMFEHEFIAKIPRKHFVPRQSLPNLSKGKKLTKVKSINPDYLYLVKVVPRRNLYELCPIEDMPAFWYFVKQNCVSRRTRIIPNLEKWIPNCGPRLIVNTTDSELSVPIYQNQNSELLPKYTKPSTTMSKCDYFPYINIFTQFGDLKPSQMLTLFTQFRSWPEYNESSFLASLENSLLKMEVSADDENIDGLEITEEDDNLNEGNIEIKGDVPTLEDTLSNKNELK